MEDRPKLAPSHDENGGQSLKKITVAHYWCGGAPGNEHSWTDPQNWLNRHVPGWFDIAIIPSGSHEYKHYPKIDEFVNDIATLIIEENAMLLISNYGRLSIDGLGKKQIGLQNNGELVVHGELTVQRTVQANVHNHGNIINAGSIALDKSESKGLVHGEKSHFENFGELLIL